MSAESTHSLYTPSPSSLPALQLPMNSIPEQFAYPDNFIVTLNKIQDVVEVLPLLPQSSAENRVASPRDTIKNVKTISPPPASEPKEPILLTAEMLKKAINIPPRPPSKPFAALSPQPSPYSSPVIAAANDPEDPDQFMLFNLET